MGFFAELGILTSKALSVCAIILKVVDNITQHSGQTIQAKTIQAKLLRTHW